MKTDAMLPKTEFKFDCPKCGQHILAATDWVGLGISCPSCQTRITIPLPPSGESHSRSATPSQPTRPTIRIDLPTKPAKNATGSINSAAIAPAGVTGNEPWPELVQLLEKGAQVEPAVLATALFRELSSVRRRLEEVERKLASQHSASSGNGAGTKLATVTEDPSPARNLAES